MNNLKQTDISLKHKNTIAQVLRYTLVLYIIAFCLKLYKGAVISSILVVEYGFSELFSYWVEKGVAIVLIFCLIGLFFKFTYKFSLVIITFFLVSYGLLSYFNGGKAFLELSLVSAISKWWLPILTIYALSGYFKNRNYNMTWFGLAIQFSIFLIFASHGLGCLLHNGLYVDYIIGFVGDYTPYSIKQQQAEIWLTIIGIVDILVAVLVLFKPFKWLMYWLIFWGILTTLLRVVDASILNYAEFLIRVPHFGLPLALLIVQNAKNKHSQTSYENKTPC